LAVPFGQRDIDITLAALNKILVAVTPMDLHIIVEERVYASTAVFPSNINSLYTFTAFDPDLDQISTTHRLYQIPVNIPGSTIIQPNLQDVRLIIQQIFMLPAVVEIYAKMVGFQMIKLH